MTNPTSGADVSDSGGWFPQIFAVEGGLYDITLKTSAGVTVKSYLGVPTIGSSTSIITRDFGNSRLRIAGSGGIVSFEGGDPSGDDTGGNVRIGGYAGTQAVAINIDGAAVSTTGTMNTGGTFTENSKKLPGIVYSYATVAAATSIIIPLTQSPSGVRAWDIDLTNIYATSGSPIVNVQFSFDDGSTYDSSASYAWGAGGATGSGATAGRLFNTLSSTAGAFAHARLRMATSTVTNRAGSNVQSALWGHTVTDAANTAYVIFQGGTNFAATHIKLVPASSTLNGTWRIVPVRGSGDA